MIDPHVHLRDWNWKHKETIEHGLRVAEQAGLDAVFDMPNTEPVIITEELVEKRLGEAEEAQQKLFAERRGFVFYGLYVGVTPDIEQVKKAVQICRNYCQKQGQQHFGVVGLKMFAGHSVGDLSVEKEEEQRRVYETLSIEGFDGVLAVHCEKESVLKPNLWDSSNPITHSFARPIKAEIESVRDQIKFAREAGYRGHLHICHVSVPYSVDLIDSVRQAGEIRISCGLTPHHCILNQDYMKKENGILYKVNPPLRDSDCPRDMLNFLRQGKIDWIETDHAPHTLAEKTSGKYMSGFPGLPFYPHFINYLRRQGFSETRIEELTHKNIARVFGIEIPVHDRLMDLNLHTEYEVDVYKDVREKLGK